MKIIPVIIYSLKLNILLIFVRLSRSNSISLSYLDSSIFERTASTTHPEEYPDSSFINNITDIPII
ncbi:hypothetical protein HYPBUDRAFT_113787 [Hyphopichia burtonii NRRL Y-1933]|uniref:Uncharacterized protein n=1 Tax=Hyphopichia burtonii NRRL Y-1933 TaxID=984485 RepID=A0A1E4RE91_9ASCO|nr:hypothetical protein HYPBUDRAFT_113787 [Hyphopichia burtonii NRRL Y-1933]ODV65588.1 hypothetical protein HYPBUDRAFT_113787 [Hyphopichia burtonii NRRL Y-1933]